MVVAALCGWLAPLPPRALAWNDYAEPVRAAGITPVIGSGAGSDAMRTRLEAMPESSVKDFYARCSQESVERRLDGGEAMACSIGYDVLLRKHFGGDFGRLHAWSRGEAR
jgi:hypothetical protein